MATSEECTPARRGSTGIRANNCITPPKQANIIPSTVHTVDCKHRKQQTNNLTLTLTLSTLVYTPDWCQFNSNTHLPQISVDCRWSKFLSKNVLSKANKTKIF